jgi:Ca2+-binding RTX toxin-like protein
LSYEALLAQGFDLTGSAGNDTIAGTNVNDRITGDTGDDTLMGGAGDDRYRFALGDGQDRIIDTAGTDTVVFGPGLNAADLTVAQRTDAEGRWLDLGFAGGANAKLSFLKSRRWRYGDSTATANNDTTWRRAA